MNTYAREATPCNALRLVRLSTFVGHDEYGAYADVQTANNGELVRVDNALHFLPVDTDVSKLQRYDVDTLNCREGDKLFTIATTVPSQDGEFYRYADVEALA